MPIYPIKNGEGPGVQSSVWSHVDLGDPYLIWRTAVCVLRETMDRRDLGDRCRSRRIGHFSGSRIRPGLFP